MVVLSVGVQMLRNGQGEKFYVVRVVRLPGTGGERYSLQRFKRVDEAVKYGVRLEKRFNRMQGNIWRQRSFFQVEGS